MKVILSRKGFDSANGQMPSPILPDGTLLSLPIPSNDDFHYSDLIWRGKSYYDIIKELAPSSSFNKETTCHLDPDIREVITPRDKAWTAAFGQTGSALSELRSFNVGIGDLFLFFGWFKQTQERNGQLKFKPGPDLHVIFGYMQIGKIIDTIDKIPDWLKYHPHASADDAAAWKKHANCIYLPTETLSFNQNLKGYGTFQFSSKVTLTKPGMSRSRWIFPHNMWNIPISHNPRGWKEDYFQSTPIGQEMIFEATEPVMNWLQEIFS